MSVGLARDYDPTIALRGGHWVNDRGIMRWKGARPVDEPDHLDPDIVCGYCGSRFWESCKSPNGSSSRPHNARTRPRTCVCGGEVKSSNYNCTACQNANADARDATDRKIRRNLERKCPHGHAQETDEKGNVRACKTCARERSRVRVARARQAQREGSDAA